MAFQQRFRHSTAAQLAQQLADGHQPDPGNKPSGLLPTRDRETDTLREVALARQRRPRPWHLANVPARPRQGARLLLPPQANRKLRHTPFRREFDRDQDGLARVLTAEPLLSP